MASIAGKAQLFAMLAWLAMAYKGCYYI